MADSCSGIRLEQGRRGVSHVSPPKGPAQATLEFVEKENGQYGITINYIGGTVDTEKRRPPAPRF